MVRLAYYTTTYSLTFRRFCPECIAAAAGILIIPEVAPAVAGLIPPPPGFPALEIGADGQATPTGDPAQGSEPTGDPRSQITASTASASASSSSSVSSDGSESTVEPPDPTGTCGLSQPHSLSRVSF